MSNATAKLDDMITQAETAIDTIHNDIARLDGLPFEQRRNLDADIDRKIGNLEQILNKMTSDLRTIPSQSKEYYESEIKNYRSDLAKCQEEMRSKRLAAANDPNMRQQAQMQSNLERTQGINNQLDEAIRIGNATNTTAAAIQTTLVDDRRHLENIDSNLDHIENEAEVGESRAKAMIRRACINGFISWFIVVLLVALLGFSIWYNFIRKNEQGK